jgi:hypothetical protein
LGQPSGGWQRKLNGEPSWAETVMGGSSLNELRSDFRTKTEFDVAVPHSLDAKH